MTGDSDDPDCGDCIRAIELARQAVARERPEDGPLKLVAVVNRLKGGLPRGPGLWQLTFKAKRAIPDDEAGLVGAGGEWIVRVDLTRPGDAPEVTRGD
jgi:hypothetical protein